MLCDLAPVGGTGVSHVFKFTLSNPKTLFFVVYPFFFVLTVMLFIAILMRSWPIGNTKCNDGNNRDHVQRNVPDFKVRIIIPVAFLDLLRGALVMSMFGM